MPEPTKSTKALTPKQEAFAQAVADGNTQADAYRKAFDVGPTTKAATVQKRASELMNIGVVSGRVAELKKQLSDKAIWTREDSLRELAKIATGGDKAAKVSDRVNAIKTLNTMQGFDSPSRVYVETPSDGKEQEAEQKPSIGQDPNEASRLYHEWVKG